MMVEDIDQYTHGRSFCPDGFMDVKFYIGADLVDTLDQDVDTFQFDLAVSSRNEDPAMILSLKISTFPVKIKAQVDSGTEEDLGEFPDLKPGEEFSLQVLCGPNSFDVYINNQKIHSIMDIHTSMEDLAVTQWGTEEFVPNCFFTSLSYNYCKF